MSRPGADHTVEDPMVEDPMVEDVAAVLQASVRLLVQRLRQTQAVEGDLTSPETSALARLDRTGPTTASELARLERISPQSMGATVGALEERGLVDPRARSGRRAPRHPVVDRERAGPVDATSKLTQPLAVGGSRGRIHPCGAQAAASRRAAHRASGAEHLMADGSGVAEATPAPAPIDKNYKWVALDQHHGCGPSWPCSTARS